jgi:transposase-like protein
VRRRYTKHDKIAAVASAEVNGIPAAAQSHGIPETTLRYWLDKPEFVELRAKTRDEMRDGFKVLVHRAQEALMGRIAEMEPRDLTILLGVATDKTLLMSGDATSRAENRSLTDGYSDDEKRKLRDWIDSLELDAPAGDAEGDTVGVGAEVREPAAT